MTNIAQHAFDTQNKVTVLSDGSKLFSSDFDSKCKFDIHRFDQIKFLRKRIKSSFAQNFLNKNKIDIIFGTHAIFQKKVIFKKLGLIIIDEQHKFGVNQRKKLSDKGGSNCDVLLMTATPIPRTLTMTIYGDMDLSIIKEKPKNRKMIKTYSKLESKIDDVIKFIKKEINLGN